MPRAGPGMKPSALQLVLSENIRLSEFHILPSHFSIYMRCRFYQTWLIFDPTFYQIVSLHCILSGSYLRSVIEMELWNFRSLQRFKLLVFSQFRHYNYPALIHQAESPRYLVFENWNLSSLPRNKQQPIIPSGDYHAIKIHQECLKWIEDSSQLATRSELIIAHQIPRRVHVGILSGSVLITLD